MIKNMQATSDVNMEGGQGKKKETDPGWWRKGIWEPESSMKRQPEVPSSSLLRDQIPSG